MEEMHILKTTFCAFLHMEKLFKKFSDIGHFSIAVKAWTFSCFNIWSDRYNFFFHFKLNKRQCFPFIFFYSTKVNYTHWMQFSCLKQYIYVTSSGLTFCYSQKLGRSWESNRENLWLHICHPLAQLERTIIRLAVPSRGILCSGLLKHKTSDWGEGSFQEAHMRIPVCCQINHYF